MADVRRTRSKAASYFVTLKGPGVGGVGCVMTNTLPKTWCDDETDAQQHFPSVYNFLIDFSVNCECLQEKKNSVIASECERLTLGNRCK